MSKRAAALLLSFVAVIAIGVAGTALMQPVRAPQATFVTLSGEVLATSELRGKVVLVNFWATSCVACVREMPAMVQAYEKFALRGYETIAVAMSYDHPNTVAHFMQRHALPFRVALDSDGAVARSFGNVRATPTSFLIDRQGRIVKRYVGEPPWEELHALVEKALGAPA